MRIKSYLEFKLDLELSYYNTFEKDETVRKLYEKYIKDKQQSIETNSRKNNNKTTQVKLCKNILEYKERKKQ